MPGPFTVQLTVDNYLNGVRIDHFLIRHFRNYTPFRMQRLVSAGQVQVDALPAIPEQRVYQGQFVTACLTEPPDKLLAPEQIPLEILYEDSWIGVLNKPAGCVAHPVGHYQSGTLCNGLQWHFDQQSAFPGLLRPGIVHRLDRQTSGVMVFSKDHYAHRSLSAQFQDRETHKIYLAITVGKPEMDEGVIDLPIGRDPTSETILMTAGPQAIKAKPATTRYKVLKSWQNRSLIQAEPLTGRNHQVRVHLAALGCPVFNDEYYGNELANDANLKLGATKFEQHALHASSLTIRHPITAQQMTFTAPMPDMFTRELELSPG